MDLGSQVCRGRFEHIPLVFCLPLFLIQSLQSHNYFRGPQNYPSDLGSRV